MSAAPTDPLQLDAYGRVLAHCRECGHDGTLSLEPETGRSVLARAVDAEQERDAAFGRIAELEKQVDRLRAELEAARKVVEAARRFHERSRDMRDGDDAHDFSRELRTALRLYDAAAAEGAGVTRRVTAQHKEWRNVSDGRQVCVSCGATWDMQGPRPPGCIQRNRRTAAPPTYLSTHPTALRLLEALEARGYDEAALGQLLRIVERQNGA